MLINYYLPGAFKFRRKKANFNPESEDNQNYKHVLYAFDIKWFIRINQYDLKWLPENAFKLIKDFQILYPQFIPFLLILKYDASFMHYETS